MLKHSINPSMTHFYANKIYAILLSVKGDIWFRVPINKQVNMTNACHMEMSCNQGMYSRINMYYCINTCVT